MLPGQEKLEEPLCKGEFLERSNLLVRSRDKPITNQAGEMLSLLGGAEHAQPTPRKRKAGCDFRFLTRADVVECFDDYRSHRLHEWSKVLNKTLDSLTDRPLHMAFLGDSRVRQHFFSLNQVASFDKFTFKSPYQILEMI